MDKLAKGNLKSCITRLRTIEVKAKEMYDFLYSYVKYGEKLDREEKHSREVKALRTNADARLLALEYAYVLKEINRDMDVQALTLPETRSDDPNNHETTRQLLHIMTIRIPGLIDLLNSEVGSLSLEQTDKLGTVRKDLTQICIDIDENYERNMVLAINSFEKGNFLGSALICGRVTSAILKGVPGKDIHEKVSYLKKKKIVDKLSAEFIVKADKKVRDIFTHEIKYFPDPQQCLSLIGDTVHIMKVLKKTTK